MTDRLCIRGCVNPPRTEGEEPTPRGAAFGHLCSVDHRRLTRALEIIPDLMANMRAQVSGTAAYRFGDRVQGGGDGSPAPLRVGPLDALDALYARLTTWIVYVADTLGQRPPTLPAWRTAPENDAQGGPSLTAEGTLVIATEMSRWLTLRLPAIEELPLVADLHDELTLGMDDDPGVFSLNRIYGPDALEVKRRSCKECGFKAVTATGAADGSLFVRCPQCDWSATSDDILVTPNDAAGYADVSRTTVLRWMRNGLQHDRDESGNATIRLGHLLHRANKDAILAH